MLVAFIRRHATLHFVVSVDPSVRSSVTILNSELFMIAKTDNNCLVHVQVHVQVSSSLGYVTNARLGAPS